MELSNSQKNSIIICTVFLGCVIVIMGFITNYNFLNSLPPVPDLSIGTGKSADAIKQEIENYKTLSAVIKENQSYLNDLLVVKFIKSLFDSLLTAIIAYLFGKPLIIAIAERLKGANKKGI